MKMKKLQQKIRQSLYRPYKSKFSANEIITDLNEIDTIVSDKIGEFNDFFGVKKKKTTGTKKDVTSKDVKGISPPEIIRK